MYYEHPFKIDGVFYAKIDGELIEITEEVARAMLSFYRKDKRQVKRWMPDLKSKEEQKKEAEELQEACGDLIDQVEKEKKAECEARKKKAEKKNGKCAQSDKPKRKDFRREMILDCVFSDNAEGLTVADLPDTEQLSTELQVLKKMEIETLYEMLAKLSEEDRYFIEAVYFHNVQQLDLAKELGISKQAMFCRIKCILARIRRLYIFGE